jgi:hypothetical protein
MTANIQAWIDWVHAHIDRDGPVDHEAHALVAFLAAASEIHEAAEAVTTTRRDYVEDRAEEADVDMALDALAAAIADLVLPPAG